MAKEEVYRLSSQRHENMDSRGGRCTGLLFNTLSGVDCNVGKRKIKYFIVAYYFSLSSGNGAQQWVSTIAAGLG